MTPSWIGLAAGVMLTIAGAANAASAEPAYVLADRNDTGAVIFVDTASIHSRGGQTEAGILVVTPDAHDPRYALVRVSSNCRADEMRLLGGEDYRIDGTRIGPLQADAGDPVDMNNPGVAALLCGRGAAAQEIFGSPREAVASLEGGQANAGDGASADAAIDHAFYYVGHADWADGRGAQVFVDLRNRERSGDVVTYWSLWVYDRPFRGEGYSGAATWGFAQVSVRCRSMTYRFESFMEANSVPREVFRSGSSGPDFAPVDPNIANDRLELQTACSPPANPDPARTFSRASEAVSRSSSLGGAAPSGKRAH